MGAADLDKILADATEEKEEDIQYMDTGNVGLDLALTDGLGLPIGASVLLWALPGVGKTTVIGDMCKRLLALHKDEPFKILYLDVENSSILLRTMGLRKSKNFILINEGLCWRQIEEFYKAILEKKPGWEDIKVVVIDSVSQIPSDQNLKKSVADGDYGTKARERNAFYCKMLPRCKEAGISNFFISQARQKQDASPFEDPFKAAVSNVDLHNVDVILKCTAKTNSTDASKIEEATVFGTDKVVEKFILVMDSKAKNRFFKGNSVEMMIEKGKKVHNYYTVRKMLEGNKYVKANGGWYTFNQDLCAGLNLPETKMRLSEINKEVNKHLCMFIDILKNAGKYRVGLKEDEVIMDNEEPFPEGDAFYKDESPEKVTIEDALIEEAPKNKSKKASTKRKSAK